MKVVSLAILIAGVILLAYGLQSRDSVLSTVSEAVTGSPTDRTLWLMILGVVGIIVGGAGVLRSLRK